MQVIYGVNAAYVLPALVSICSLWKHVSQPVAITLYVDGITEQNQYAIQCVNDTCGMSIQVKEFDSTGLEGYDNPRFPAISLLPLFLPSLEKGRCLFIDADTLVRGDVWELLSVDMAGMLIGACIDVGMLTLLQRRMLKVRASDLFRSAYIRQQRQHCLDRIDGFGFVPKENYFNSGVLVMECDAIREQCLGYADLASLEKLRPFAHFPDQDRLNQFFAGRWYRLPLTWNVRPGLKRDVEWRQYRFRHVSDELRGHMHNAAISPKLWHFMGAKKPWVKRWRNALKVRQAYREYADTCFEFWTQTGIRFGL